jgi:hypothetical protein
MRYCPVTFVRLLIHVRSQAFSEHSSHQYPGNDGRGRFEDSLRIVQRQTTNRRCTGILQL